MKMWDQKFKLLKKILKADIARKILYILFCFEQSKIKYNKPKRKWYSFTSIIKRDLYYTRIMVETNGIPRNDY